MIFWNTFWDTFLWIIFCNTFLDTERIISLQRELRQWTIRPSIWLLIWEHQFWRPEMGNQAWIAGLYDCSLFSWTFCWVDIFCNTFLDTFLQFSWTSCWVMQKKSKNMKGCSALLVSPWEVQSSAIAGFSSEPWKCSEKQDWAAKKAELSGKNYRKAGLIGKNYRKAGLSGKQVQKSRIEQQKKWIKAGLSVKKLQKSRIKQ